LDSDSRHSEQLGGGGGGTFIFINVVIVAVEIRIRIWCNYCKYFMPLTTQ
jgi:hypothetical protein